MTSRAATVSVKPLEPLLDPSGDWTREFLSTTLSRPRGDDFTYRGHALKPRADTGSRLHLECTTSVLRRAHVRLPICIDVETIVRVFVDGALARTVTLGPAGKGRPTLRILAHDITRWTERAETTRLQLQFTSETRSNLLAILVSEDTPHCRAVVRQPPGRRYALTSSLFFLVTWATLLSLAVVALASLPVEETLRAYAVIATCVLWVAGLFGLPDLARLPVRALIRRLFAATAPTRGAVMRYRRELVVAALTGALVVSGLALGRVVRGIRIRQQYSALIRAGMQSQSDAPVSPEVIEALLLAPWRTEAQVLVERSAFRARQAGLDSQQFRQVAQAMANPAIEAAMRQSLAGGQPWFLTGTPRRAVQNPVVWYATFILEGEIEAESALESRARALLKTAANGDREAALLVRILDLGAASADPLTDDSTLDKLTAALEEQVGVTPPVYNGSHTYLSACDSLATAYLARCDKGAAKRWLQAELRARSNATNDALWFRPPEKFVAYYLFARYGGMNDHGVNSEADGWKKAELLSVREDCDFRTDIASIAANVASQFKSRAKWLEGTVFGSLFTDPSALRSYFEGTLAEGWRY